MLTAQHLPECGWKTANLWFLERDSASMMATECCLSVLWTGAMPESFFVMSAMISVLRQPNANLQSIVSTFNYSLICCSTFLIRIFSLQSHHNYHCFNDLLCHLFRWTWQTNNQSVANTRRAWGECYSYMLCCFPAQGNFLLEVQTHADERACALHPWDEYDAPGEVYLYCPKSCHWSGSLCVPHPEWYLSSLSFFSNLLILMCDCKKWKRQSNVFFIWSRLLYYHQCFYVHVGLHCSDLGGTDIGLKTVCGNRCYITRSLILINNCVHFDYVCVYRSVQV